MNTEELQRLVRVETKQNEMLTRMEKLENKMERVLVLIERGYGVKIAFAWVASIVSVVIGGIWAVIKHT